MIETTLTLSYSEAVKPAEILSVLDVNVNQVKTIMVTNPKGATTFEFFTWFQRTFIRQPHSFFYYVVLVKKFNWFKMN